MGDMSKGLHQLLFVGGQDASCSAMAAAFANAKGRDDVMALYAGIDSGVVSPLTWRILSEFQLAPPERGGLVIGGLGSRVVDVVVTTCAAARSSCVILPGNPLHLHWDLADPVGIKGDREWQLKAFREVCATIKRLVDDLFDQGYLEALLQWRGTSNLIMDNISEGVIAHDFNRRIFFFNAAAETITGYKRDEVLNRDCHQAIPGGLCGAKCSFCDGQKPPEVPFSKEVEITTAAGERRRIFMNINNMIGEGGKQIGVLACFRDLTRETQLARRLGEVEQFSGIIGRDPKMLALYDLIPELAESPAPVLIQGESGTGKELVAAALHHEGPRAKHAFVPVNCGALPEGLLESELFGHVKGAFTGAIRDKMGRFELADGGTIFLDEIGDISPAMQVKLLRVLQEGCFERVGGEKTIKVNVRVISATHRDLRAEMAAGKFREDLFYRLSVVPLVLPPLRERRLDVPLLANHFLKHMAPGKAMRFSDEAMGVILDYDWPGNVRELQNWIQFALIKCKNGIIQREHLPPVALDGVAARRVAMGPTEGRGRARLTAKMVQEAIRNASGNKVKAARALGVSRATFYRFLTSKDG